MTAQPLDSDSEIASPFLDRRADMVRKTLSKLIVDDPSSTSAGETTPEGGPSSGAASGHTELPNQRTDERLAPSREPFQQLPIERADSADFIEVMEPDSCSSEGATSRPGSGRAGGRSGHRRTASRFCAESPRTSSGSNKYDDFEVYSMQSLERVGSAAVTDVAGVEGSTSAEDEDGDEEFGDENAEPQEATYTAPEGST